MGQVYLFDDVQAAADEQLMTSTVSAPALPGNNFYLWGWSGNRNTGDDAFLYVTAWGLRRFCGARGLYMDADMSGQASAVADVRTAEPHRFRLPGLTRTRRAWYRHRSDYFVVAGGSLFTTEAGTAELLRDSHWDKKGKRRVAVGVSVGPFQSRRHEHVMAELLSRFEFVAMRDDYSFDWAVHTPGVQSRIVRAFDLAALLPIAASVSVGSGAQNVLGVSLLDRGLLGGVREASRDIEGARMIGDVVAEVIAGGSNWRVLAFVLCSHPRFDDRPITDAFASRLPTGTPCDIVVHEGDPVHTFGHIQRCSHMLSMRLHGCILAYAANIPFVMLSYHAKCKEFARTVGLEDWRLYDHPTTSSDIRATVERLLHSSDTGVQLPQATAQARASLNFAFAPATAMPAVPEVITHV